MIGSFILLSLGLAAANPIGFELLKDHLFKKNKEQQQQPVYVTGQHYYQQAVPSLTYGPPEQIGSYPQPGPTTIVGTAPGPQYPTWQWPQKQIYQKPVTVYQPVVHVSKPQFVPVIKPYHVYKQDIKSGFVSKIEGIKSEIADKIAGVKAVASGIKSGIGSKIADKVTGVKQTVSGIKAHVADGITDKIVGLKVIGAHIGDKVKEIGTDLYNKKHHKPQYVLVPAIPQGPTYTYTQQPHYPTHIGGYGKPTINVDPPSLTYGAPELAVN